MNPSQSHKSDTVYSQCKMQIQKNVCTPCRTAYIYSVLSYTVCIVGYWWYAFPDILMYICILYVVHQNDVAFTFSFLILPQLYIFSDWKTIPSWHMQMHIELTEKTFQMNNYKIENKKMKKKKECREQKMNYVPALLCFAIMDKKSMRKIMIVGHIVPLCNSQAGTIYVDDMFVEIYLLAYSNHIFFFS